MPNEPKIHLDIVGLFWSIHSVDIYIICSNIFLVIRVVSFQEMDLLSLHIYVFD